jgi:drug/metabolite transporter (DMT)-like permease
MSAVLAGPRPVLSPMVGGMLLAVASAATFGTSGVFAKSLIEAGWTPAAAVLMRVSGAALVLLIPALIALKGQFGVVRRNIGLITAYGVIAVAGCQLAYFNAVQTLSPGVALMLEYLAPVLLVGWMWLRHGKRPNRWTAVGVLLSLAGLALVLNLASGMTLAPAGLMWGLLAAVGLACYFVLSDKGEAGLSPLVMAAGGLTTGTLALLVLGVVGVMPLRATNAPVTVGGMAMSWVYPAVALILVATVTAYLAGIVAVRRLGPTIASFVGLTEVMFAVLWTWLLLADLPTGSQLLGGLLILAGVAAIKAAERRDGKTAFPQNPASEQIRV